MRALALLPQITLSINSQSLDAEIMNSLESIWLRQELNKPSLCELCLIGNIDAKKWKVGQRLECQVDNASEEFFVGEITAIECSYGPDSQIRTYLKAYDALWRLRTHQPVRSFQDLSLSQLARELTNDIDLEVQSYGGEFTWPYIMQFDQSDLELLEEYSLRAGLSFRVRAGVLEFLSPGSASAETTLRLGEDLIEARLGENIEEDLSSVNTLSWSATSLEHFRGMALESRYASRLSGDAAIEIDKTLAGEQSPSGEESADIAQAHLDNAQSRARYCKGVAAGNPQIRAGAEIELSGLNTAFDGQYLVQSATHSINSSHGYTTEFDTRAPRQNQRQQSSSMTPARVIHVDDPEDLGRIKVSWPSFDDLESPWINVVFPGAGANKGLVCLPDAGDQVLCLFNQGDPGNSVVLGGLYAPESPPDSGVSDGRVQKFSFQSASGHLIELDDQQQSVQVLDGAGSSILLHPGGIQMSSQKDILIEAPGNTLKLRANKIDLERT